MIKDAKPLKGYLNFSEVFVSEEELDNSFWQRAEAMVDPRLHHNLRKGAKFEAYIFLLIEHIIQLLGLDKILKATHNPFSYRRYFSRKGRGIDLMIWRKKGSNWLPLIAIEVKDWLERWVSPAQLKTHVLNRFKDIVGATKLLICRGIRFGAKTKRQLQLNNINVVRNRLMSTLKQTILNEMYKGKKPTNNISNSIPLHKVVFNKYTLEGSEQYQTPNLTPYFNVQSVGCGEYG